MRRIVATTSIVLWGILVVVAALAITFGPMIVDRINGDMLVPSKAPANSCAPAQAEACNQIIEGAKGGVFLQEVAVVAGFILPPA
jgi:hypothetical protein